MPGIEDEPEKCRVRQLKQPRDFIRSFNVSSAMMMENRPQSCFVANGSRNLLGAGSESLPLSGLQSHLWRNATCILGALRNTSVIVGQHKKGCRISCHRREQASGLHRSFYPHAMSGGVF